MGLTFREIAQRFCLSPGTAHNHFKQFVSTGEVALKQSTGVASGMRKLNYWLAVRCSIIVFK
jgi:transposase